MSADVREARGRFGDALVLSSGGTTAVVAPREGGRLVQLDFGTGPLLRPRSEDTGWAGWGCYPMAPWVNRIPGGRLTVGDVDWELPVNWPDGSAIHGLVASCPWEVDEVSDDAALLSVDAAEGPYTVRCTAQYRTGPGSLEMALAVRNRGDDAVPAGLGIHPWFRSGPVRIPARSAWPGEPIPNGPPVPLAAHEDLNDLKRPGPMDRCHTDLTANHVEAPGVTVAWSGPITQVVVYTGEPDWMAVEPATMVNDGFRLASEGCSGHGVSILEPEESLSVTYRFTSTATGTR